LAKAPGGTAPGAAGPARYEFLEELPTDQGRSVHIARTDDGERVLIKQAYDDAWAADLREQARHFQVMRGLLGAGAPYPEVLRHGERLLVLPYYPYGSLDDLSLGDDKALVTELTGSAIGELFRICLVEPEGFQLSEKRVDAARSYLTSHVDKRLARLHRALSSASGAAWAAQPHAPGRTRGEALSLGLTWITDGRLAAHAGRLGPPRLALAAHGDFGLNNVMLMDPPAPGARPVFIDTRCQWIGGLPWWDPIMDLATLMAFHCRIEPAFARAGGRTSPRVLHAQGRLTEAEIRDLADGHAAVRAWSASDPGYRDRLEVEIAIRLLGSIGVQLLTAHSHGAERASAVLDLYLDQAAQVGRLLGARPL
jgi:hypothetical protein